MKKPRGRSITNCWDNEFLQTEESHLVKIDGDNQFKQIDIEKLIELSNEGYDFVKCDRFGKRN